MKKRVKNLEVDALTSFFTLFYLYREERLANLGAGFDVVLHGGDTDGAVPILGGENHAFADEAVLELTWSKVGNEEHHHDVCLSEPQQNPYSDCRYISDSTASLRRD